MALRLAAISLCCSLRARSRSRARRILRALALFLCCDFSSWQVTTRPVGRCVTRTAESVVLTLCPPGPEGRYPAMRRSLSAHSPSTAPAPGHTATGRPEGRQLAARQLAQLGVLLAQQLPVLVGVARHALALAPAGDRLRELGALPGEPRELAPVGDHARVGDQAFQLLVAPLDLG